VLDCTVHGRFRAQTNTRWPPSLPTSTAAKQDLVGLLVDPRLQSDLVGIDSATDRERVSCAHDMGAGCSARHPEPSASPRVSPAGFGGTA
jgi:hypothetical protein